MSSTIYRRLQGLFSGSTTTISLKPKKKPKPTVPSPTVSQRKTAKTATRPLRPAGSLRFIADKFKKSSDSKRFRFHAQNYEAVIGRLARAQQFSYIEDILEHQKKYGEDMTHEGFVVRLIILYGKSGMLDHAHKLFNEMPQFNCTRTVLSFNALLAACVNSKKFKKVSKFFREFPQKLSIEPDTVSYNTVIKAFCKMHEMESAILAVDEMEKNGCKPNLITFNTIIDAFYQKGKFSDAEKVWVQMESKNLVPDVMSYNSKLRGLIVYKQISEAVNLIEEMERRGVKPDVYTYNGLIQGFCKDGNLAEVKKWYGEIAMNDLLPDRVTFWMVIPFACDKGDFGFAFEVCKKALSQKYVIGKSTMQLVVDGLVKELDIDEAKELVELVKTTDHLHYKVKLPTDK